MSQTIELPDPLFAEITDYATEVAASPVVVLKQAWEEFRHRHPKLTTPPKLTQQELQTLAASLRGSISLPESVDYKTLIADARMEKYGPL